MNELELIELYLKNELDGEALSNFDKRLQSDEAFRKEVEQHKNILDGFHYLKMEALREKLKERSKDLPKLQPESAKEVKLSRRSSFNILKKLTAAVLVLAVGGYAWWNMQSDSFLDQLISDSYYGFDDSTKRSEESVFDQDAKINFEKARVAYNSENYKLCIDILRSIQNSDSLYLLAQHLMQYAYYEHGNYKKSLSTFEDYIPLQSKTIYKTENINFTDAEWTAILAVSNIYKRNKSKSNKANLKDRVNNFLIKSPKKIYREPAEELRSWLE